MTQLLPPGGGSPRDTATAVNQALKGKINSVDRVTLTANAATTTVNNAFVSKSSVIVLVPETANASAIAAPYVLRANITEGESFIITHANNANTDKIFSLAILG